MINKKSSHILLFLFLFSTMYVAAQQDTIYTTAEKNRAIHAIKDIKEGALIVRLPGKHKKLQAMRQELERGKKTKRKEKQYAKELWERDNFASKTMQAFKSKYTFSSVFFVYDTAMTHIRNGARSGFLLNDSLQVDTSLTIPQGPVYTLKLAYLDFENTTRIKCWIVTDAKNKELHRPFPYYVKLYGVGRLNLFYEGKITKEWAERIAIQFDKHFHKYYKKVKRNF